MLTQVKKIQTQDLVTNKIIHVKGLAAKHHVPASDSACLNLDPRQRTLSLLMPTKSFYKSCWYTMVEWPFTLPNAGLGKKLKTKVKNILNKLICSYMKRPSSTSSRENCQYLDT